MPFGKSENSKEKELDAGERAESATVKYLVESLQAVQKENELLKMQLAKSRQVPAGRIGFVLLIFGVLALAGSIWSASTVLAFIGLGITFWGALFLFVRPIRFVKEALLEWNAISSYKIIDRIIDDLGYKGKALYIPPYPKDVYLPEYLKGLKEMVVLIPDKDTAAMPTIEEMAKGQFIVENPRGICITPPGFGVMSLFEKELRLDFTKLAPERFPSVLPKLATSDLQLARNVQISTDKSLVHVKIEGSAYKDLYSQERGLKSIHLVGCPLASAIACALSKATGRLVAIMKDEISPDLKTIELWLQVLEG